MGGGRDVYLVYFDPKGDAAAPAEKRKLIGSPHAERKRTGKDRCRYASGRGEDLTEPLLHAPASTCGSCFTCPCLYRRWRNPEGTQREGRVPHPKAPPGGGTARRWKGGGRTDSEAPAPPEEGPPEEGPPEDKAEGARRGSERSGPNGQAGAKGKPPEDYWKRDYWKRDYWKRGTQPRSVEQARRLVGTLDAVL